MGVLAMTSADHTPMRTKLRPITAHLHQIARPIARLSREEMEAAVELGAGDVTGNSPRFYPSALSPTPIGNQREA